MSVSSILGRLSFAVDKSGDKLYNPNMKKMLIVDFMFLWNRLYYFDKVGIGEKILRILDKIDEEVYYDKVIFVFDSATSTNRRKKLLPEYKGNRPEKELVYKGITDFVNKAKKKHPHFEFLVSEFYEADDIIASIAQTNWDYQISIYSGDRDLYQLLPLDYVMINDKYTGGMVLEKMSRDDYVEIIKKRFYGTDNVTDIVKWKTFKGDSSDNIPVAVPRLPNQVINHLIGWYWHGTEPLTSKILFDMNKCLLKHYKKENYAQKFFDNRKNIIRNYKLVQLTHQNHGRILEFTKSF